MAPPKRKTGGGRTTPKGTRPGEQRFANPDENEKGELATAADKVFDKALELDDRQRDARFTKAVTLTFWPDFLGKKPEAKRTWERGLRRFPQDDELKSKLR